MADDKRICHHFMPSENSMNNTLTKIYKNGETPVHDLHNSIMWKKYIFFCFMIKLLVTFVAPTISFKITEQLNSLNQIFFFQKVFLSYSSKKRIFSSLNCTNEESHFIVLHY